jgi:quercetin dioxygenase-like cupin family protein
MRPFAEAFPAENVSHHFAGGVYAKELRIPAGYKLVSHSHPYAHLSILASGTVMLDDAATMVTGPQALTIEAGVRHSVAAVTDAIWFCIHSTAETDPDKVDAVILAREP